MYFTFSVYIFRSQCPLAQCTHTYSSQILDFISKISSCQTQKYLSSLQSASCVFLITYILYGNECMHCNQEKDRHTSSTKNVTNVFRAFHFLLRYKMLSRNTTRHICKYSQQNKTENKRSVETISTATVYQNVPERFERERERAEK